jgi:hypothetical protein
MPYEKKKTGENEKMRVKDKRVTSEKDSKKKPKTKKGKNKKKNEGNEL